MIARISLVAALLVTTAPLAAQEAPIVLPGAPGAEPRVIDAAEAIALSDTRFSPADVSFMQGIISKPSIWRNWSGSAPITKRC